MPDRSCSVVTCDAPVWNFNADSPDYCRPHHFRWRTKGDPLWEPACAVEGCKRKFLAKGYCKPHYRRWTETGDPGPAVLPRDMTNLERFHSKVFVEPNGCWRWTSTLSEAGYGVFNVDNWPRSATRWGYTAMVGPIPEGLYLDHFRFPQDGCIGPACANPEHLRPVTPRENALRGETVSAENRAKDACKWGHEFTPENTYQRPEGRRCRQCRSDQRIARRARLRC